MEEPDRNIFLFEDIDEDNSKKIIFQIYKINNFDDTQEMYNYEYIRKPIYFLINSTGGLCSPAFAIMTTILNSKTPVYTQILGKAYSMSICIAMCGVKGYRTISEFSDIIIHGLSTSAENGKITYAELQLDIAKLYQNNIRNFLLKRSQIPERIINDVFDYDKDLLLTPEKALEYKIVDKII